MSDETRYGYNELLLDRFVNGDDDNNKLQPSYIVYYKFDDEYEKDHRFSDSVKVASDFNIPVMVVDVPKIKEFERQEINKMREELFSKDSVDSELVKKIVTRYMNNYTGAANFVGYFRSESGVYPNDFSEDDLKSFIDEYLEKANTASSLEEFKSWTDALYDVYCEESRKYDESRRVAPESYSLTWFFLDHINFLGKLNSKIETFNYEKNISKDNNFFEETININQLLDSNALVLEIAEILNDSQEFKITKNGFEYLISCLNEEALEDKLYCNLAISYLFGNTSLLIDDVISNGIKKETPINGDENFDFVNSVMNSPYKDQLIKSNLNSDKLDAMINKVETNMEYFSKLAYPYLRGEYGTGEAMYILDNFSYRKYTIRDDFNKLKNSINSLKVGEDNIGENGKKL